MSTPKIHINIDNITEILGYYHHEISKHTNEISTIKQNIHELSEKKYDYEKTDSALPLFISSSNARLESFAASINSLSQQMVMMEDTIHKIRDQFDSKISTLNKHINELETKIELNSHTITNESNIDVFIPDSIKSKDENSKSLIKKSSKKKKLTTLKDRPKYTNHTSQKIAFQETNQDNNEKIELETLIQSQNKALMDEISHLKQSINECKHETDPNSLHDILIKSNKETEAEFADIYNRLENFVTHDELEKMIIDELEKNKSALIIPDRNKPRAPIQTPRKTVHVTLINGETLSEKRQKQIVKQKYSNTTPNIAYSKKWHSIYE